MAFLEVQHPSNKVPEIFFWIPTDKGLTGRIKDLDSGGVVSTKFMNETQISI